MNDFDTALKLISSLTATANAVSNTGFCSSPQSDKKTQVDSAPQAYPSPCFPAANTSVSTFQQNYYGTSPYAMTPPTSASLQRSAESCSMSDFVIDVVQRNAYFIDQSKELAEAYCKIQSKIDSKQDWLDNQNGFQRFWNGLNGKTKNVEKDMNRYTRESVGVLAKEVNILSDQNSMLMKTIVEMGYRYERQEAMHNQQNQIYNKIIRRLISDEDDSM